MHCWDSIGGLQTFTDYYLLQVSNTTLIHAWTPEAFRDPGRYK